MERQIERQVERQVEIYRPARQIVVKSTIIKLIVFKMTKELLNFLVYDEADLDSGTAIRILLDYEQEIIKAAEDMYKVYNKNNELEKLSNVNIKWCREFLEDIYLDLECKLGI